MDKETFRVRSADDVELFTQETVERGTKTKLVLHPPYYKKRIAERFAGHP